MKTLDDVLDDFYEAEFSSPISQISYDWCNELLAKLDQSIERFYNKCPNWTEVDENDNFQDILINLIYLTNNDSGALISLFTYDRDMLACQVLMGKSVHSNYKLPILKMAETIKS